MANGICAADHLCRVGREAPRHPGGSDDLSIKTSTAGLAGKGGGHDRLPTEAAVRTVTSSADDHRFTTKKFPCTAYNSLYAVQ